MTLLAIVPSGLAEEARRCGAAHAGAIELVDDIVSGALAFDRCVATVDQMPLLGRLARILGPRGLMPNVKTGTLVGSTAEEVRGAVRDAIERTPFRIEREAATLALVVGDGSFARDQVQANVRVAMAFGEGHNGACEGGRFLSEGRLVVRWEEEGAAEPLLILPLDKGEFGRTSGPSFLVALERARAQRSLRHARWRAAAAKAAR